MLSKVLISKQARGKVHRYGHMHALQAESELGNEIGPDQKMRPWCAQDAVGMDMRLLDAVQSKIVSLYAPVAEASPPHPGAQRPLAEVFARCVESCMYKATNELLDDLHRNYRLLGTPERCSLLPSLFCGDDMWALFSGNHVRPLGGEALQAE